MSYVCLSCLKHTHSSGRPMVLAPQVSSLCPNSPKCIDQTCTIFCISIISVKLTQKNMHILKTDHSYDVRAALTQMMHLL